MRTNRWYTYCDDSKCACIGRHEIIIENKILQEINGSSANCATTKTLGENNVF